jgi:UDP-N-acetyl-D-glucosamine dehydrogenase
MVLREISLTPIDFRKAKILILGVAFKRNVDDIRHSPALKVMEILINEGASDIQYNDPFVPHISINGFEYSSIALTEELLQSSDCVVITTDHASYDYEWIVKNSKKVIDTRNATKNVRIGKEKITLLGDGK